MYVTLAYLENRLSVLKSGNNITLILCDYKLLIDEQRRGKSAAACFRKEAVQMENITKKDLLPLSNRCEERY